jgi:hypothetical protein
MIDLWRSGLEEHRSLGCNSHCRSDSCTVLGEA